MTSKTKNDAKKDVQERLRHTDHTEELLEPSEVAASGSLYKIAGEYLKKVAGVPAVQSSKVVALEKVGEVTKGDDELVLTDSKELRDLTVLQYTQLHQGLPVWRRGAAVIVQTATKEVLESTNTVDYEVKDVKVDQALLRRSARGLTHEKLSQMLSLDKNAKRIEKISGRKVNVSKAKLSINSSQPVIYKYVSAERQKDEKEDKHEDFNLVLRAIRLVLPPVDPSIKEGAYYAVNEVFLALKYEANEMHVHALIEPETNSVLYIRPLVDLASAWIYDNDPLNVTGDISITPGSSVAVLNGPRTPRPLPGNLGGSPVSLNGEYVVLQDICPLPIAPPTDLNGRFDYNADTDNFSAANAYYHNDFAFRMVEEMGFTMSSYFDGTPFPVPVDHMGCFTCVNAAVWGLNGKGTGFITYGFAQASQPVGIAAAVGVVLHEFGHVILLDNAWSGNFGFAHSCGDSLAALYCDPHSKAPDRFLTFPWITVSTPSLDRRHDRPIAGGWAWGGVNDDGGYGSEQILSTSHFRAYLSMGGGSAELCDREWASRYLLFLIIYGVGTLTQPTNPVDPEPWADRLQFLDRATPVFEGHPGGAVHKVIRWAFEQQGAYQPAGAPTPVTTIGNPPVNDIYINDGRNGEYGYTDDFCHSLEIWNRNCADNDPAHQQPIPGIDNYAYVIVRNRGTKPVPAGWTITGYHLRDNTCCGCCDDCKDLQWPKDFVKMKKPLYVSTEPIAPGDYQITSALTWKPGENDCMMMVADAKGDPSNINFIRAGESIPAKRLVPLDNNIAMRCLCKQCNPDYSKLKSPCAKDRQGS